MKSAMRLPVWCCLSVCLASLAGCHGAGRAGPPYDRPFPLGQVSDAHWETQQTNGEASDFIFYDHEFVGDTDQLTPAGKKHLLQVGLRLEHVPFPVIVEQSENNGRPRLDAQRRVAIVQRLNQIGVPAPDQRVVIAPAIAEGLSAIEGESAYYTTLQGGDGSGSFNRGAAGWGTNSRR